jgi:hypothetical protein
MEGREEDLTSNKVSSQAAYGGNLSVIQQSVFV